MAELTDTRGLPRAVVDDVYLAPVHIDVGGTTYTTTLTTLTKYPNSKLAKLFNGTLAITLDPINRHYFLDVDGSVFTHILNFLRYDKLVLPEDFNQLPLLKEQAAFFEMEEMLAAVANTKEDDIEEEGEAEDENVTSRPRRRRRRRTTEGRRYEEEQGGKGEELAIEQGQAEAEGGSDVVIVKALYDRSKGYGIDLYSSAKLSLEEPLPGYDNLKLRTVGVGHLVQYQFITYTANKKNPPCISNFDPCFTHFFKQLLDKGYKLSAVARTAKEEDCNKYLFTRLKKYNIDQSCDTAA